MKGRIRKYKKYGVPFKGRIRKYKKYDVPFKGMIRKYKKYDAPFVSGHVIRVTGATEVEFGALILDWRGRILIQPTFG